MGQTSLRDIGNAAKLRAAAMAAAAVCWLAAAAPEPPGATAAGPAVCPTGQQAVTAYLTDFENAAETLTVWRASLPAGAPPMPATDGRLAQSHWHLPPPAPGDYPWSGSLNIWADILAGGPGRYGPGESMIELLRGFELPSAARLSFVHRFDFTAVPGSWGIVEASLDGGRSWRSLGGFSGAIESHRSSHFDLSAFAGQAFRLRFRLAVAAVDGDLPAAGDAFRGWAIDDVHLYTCAPGPPATDDRVVPEPARQIKPAPLGMVAMSHPRVLRGRTSLRLRLVNTSRGPLRRLRICFRAPRRLIAGRRCARLKLLPAGAGAEVSFPVAVTPAALRRKRIGVVFAARRGKTVLATARRGYRLAAPKDSSRRAGARKTPRSQLPDRISKRNLTS